MSRYLLAVLAAFAFLGLTSSTTVWSAEEAAQAPSIEERLAALESANAATTASMNSAAMNNGDNAWMMTSALLVLLMTIPGLALFYGGLVRRKNVLATMMQSFALAAAISVIWAIFGYSVAFGPGDSQPKLDDKGAQVMADDGTTPVMEPAGSARFFGGGAYVMLNNVLWSETKDETGAVTGSTPGPYGSYSASIPHGTFMLFQLMFAIITPALICGAFAERMKFSAMLGFTLGWFCLVYLPLAHMVWGENGYFNWGFNNNMGGAFDFAGGTVVHISSGFAALIAALVIGKRRGYPNQPMYPHSIVLSFIGASLLWVGWFGFNAGSALSAGVLSTLAFGNTHFATAAAAITWPLAEWILRGKPTVLGAISGAVAGLVAITPACGFVTPGSALIIGAIAGVLCMCTSSYLKRALGYDDALDAFGVHGVGGTWGAIATGIFLNPDANPGVKALNPGLYEALINGTHPVIALQIKAVLISIVLTVVGSLIVLGIIKLILGLRPSAEDESSGLDVTQHGEEGYNDAA